MSEYNLFAGKTLLITGGTGSFGKVVLDHFIKTDIAEIRIFSRDEKKQDDMRHEFQAAYPEAAGKLRFFIGDVRCQASLRDAMRGVDYVFHAAALKQVPPCEFFPMEAVRTNVEGTDNVIGAAVDARVRAVICLSTDKAAYPVSAMGITKALEERIAVAKSRMTDDTKICCTRFGNLICSRGSVIPLWIEQLKSGRPLTVTDPDMTRFIMTLDEAIELVLYAFGEGKNGDILVLKSASARVGDQARALIELFGAEKTARVQVIGSRHGEKLRETLLTDEESIRAVDLGRYFRIPADDRGLNYDLEALTPADSAVPDISGFSSDRIKPLTIAEIKAKFLETEYIRRELDEWKRQV